MKEQFPKFEHTGASRQSDVVEDAATAEVVSLSDWRQARESAPQTVAERAPGLLESEASSEKAAALRALLATFEAELEDDTRTRAEHRAVYYAVEEAARVLAETELILSGEQVLVRNERGELPDTPPAEYGGVARFVPREKRQNLRPANDNRLATPALMYGA